MNQDPPEAPVNVLLVDHLPTRRAGIRKMLDLPGIRVVEASSAKEALLRLLEEEFAVLFITVVMPEMGGLELASLIRQRPRTMRVPIVFVTAVATEPESMLEGYSFGGVDYLIEPLVPEMVRAKVTAFAELYRARQQLQEQSRALFEAQRKEREVELLELRLATERRYRSLADAIPHIVFTATRDGTIDFLNRRWFEYTGLSRADAVEGWVSALHPDDAAMCKESFEAAVVADEPFQVECRIRRGSDGHYRWHLFRAIPEHGSTGELVSWIGTFTDVDQTRRAHESLAEFRAMLDAVHEAVIIFEPRSMRLLDANQGASRLFGLPTAELLKQRADSLVNDADVENFAKTLESLTKYEAGSRKIDVRCRRGDGGTIPAELLMQYVPGAQGDDGEGRAIAIARDTSERQRAEAERELLYRNALEAVRARDEFLSIASHELKSPLTALSMQLDALMKQRGLSTEVVGQKPLVDKLKFAKRQVERLSRLLNELLDVSRIHAGRLSLELEDVDMAALVRDIADRFADSAANVQSELAVAAKGPCVGRWDRLRLEQVIVNLLSNALKFGSGKPIEMSVEADAGNQMARLTVRDHGIGIAPEEVDRIFSRFERAVPARSYAGLGLGLYIVRQIVVAHGGTIHVASKPGEGAEFRVDLPMLAPRTSERPADDVDAGSASEPPSEG